MENRTATSSKKDRLDNIFERCFTLPEIEESRLRNWEVLPGLVRRSSIYSVGGSDVKALCNR